MTEMACSSSAVLDSASTILADEFQTWFESHSTSEFIMFLADTQQLPSGEVKLECSFSDAVSFNIRVGKDYPSNAQFKIDSCSKQLGAFCEHVGQWAASHKGSIKLPALLSFAYSAYDASAPNKVSSSSTRAKQSDEPMSVSEADTRCSSGMGSTNEEADEQEQDDDYAGTSDSDMEYEEDDDGEEYDLPEDAVFTTDFEIECDLRKKQWMVKEQELRERLAQEKAKKAGGGPRASYKMKRAAVSSVIPKQQGDMIFDHDSAAFQILSNDMIRLWKSGKDDGFVVDTIDDDLYKWTVKVTQFACDSQLHADMQQVKQKFGYDYIELRLVGASFEPTYPYYPPSLYVVRPRFQGTLEHSLANIDLLKLTYWNPAHSMAEVLTQIKEILQKHARININSSANDLCSSPDGSYTPLDNFLIQLSFVGHLFATTEIRPRAVYELLDIANLPKAPPINYGASKQRKPSDSQSDESKSQQGGGNKGWAKGTGYSSAFYQQQQRDWQPKELEKAKQEKEKKEISVLNDIAFYVQTCEEAERVQKAMCSLEGSCLVPYLIDRLQQDSFLEMERHGDMYSAVVLVAETVLEHPVLCHVLRAVYCRQHKCTVEDALRTAANNARNYLSDLEAFNQSGTEPENRKPGTRSTAKKSKPSVDLPDLSDDQGVPERIASRIVALDSKLASMPAPAEAEDACSSSSRGGACSTAVMRQMSTQKLEDDYAAAMRPIQFRSVAFEDSELRAPPASASPSLGRSLNAKAVKTIFRERTSLRNSLPLKRASSVFVRVDDAKLNYMQALIVGPEDTPYENGCFLFQFHFKENYPSVPPDVKLLTTGAGSVRFNPNLYNCGKVCLSLLGTWSGSASEQWSPETSSVLQVLVSIQSLILIPDPYFNEPGHERSRGTTSGDSASEKYNKNIRQQCLKWAVYEQLRSPPRGFEEVVKKHFLMKRDAMRKQLADWSKLDGGATKDLAAKINQELDKLI